MKQPWLKNNKPILKDGKPVLCTRCPCEGGEQTCQNLVDAEANRLLAIVDEQTQLHIWEQINSGVANYTCAVWQQDAETGDWYLVQQAQGNLLIAVKRGSGITDVVGYGAYLLVYARVLRNTQTNAVITIGCRCVISNHECNHEMITLTDYVLAGSLAVYTPAEGEEYTPNDACRVDVCDLAQLKLRYAQTLYGGTLYTEGYYDWFDGGDSPMFYQYEKWLLALYWDDYYNNEHHYKLTYIDCDCDSEYATTHTMQSGEKLHLMSGVCALDNDCGTGLMFRLRSYDDEGGWDVVASVLTDYECLQSAYNEQTGNYEIISPATGHLVVACIRSDYISNYGYTLFVHAITVRSRETGQYVTFGCTCNYSYYNRQCDLQVQELQDYCIGGVLPVIPTPEESNSDSDSVAHYPPEAWQHACSVGVCEAYMLMFDCYEEWHNWTAYNEGYIETIDEYNAFSYSKFKRLLLDVDEYIYLDCACDSVQYGRLGQNDSIHALTGICSNPDCEKVFVLRKSALDNGWLWHDEGILVHLAYDMHYDEQTWEPVFVFGDWYDSRDRHAYLACAEAENCFYVVSCGCNGIETIDKNSIDWYTPALPEDFRLYMEYEGACSCVDERELLLEYPDLFGVIEISYGNNSKYSYTLTTSYEDIIYNPETGDYEWGTITNTTNGYNVVGKRTGNYGQDMFLDYRTFCWIGKHLDSDGTQKVHVRYISPNGSPAGNWDSDYYSDRVYDTASFVGYVYPFETDTDTGMQWWGQYYQWRSESYAFDEYYATEAEAQEACGNHTPSTPTVCGISDYDGPRYAPCVTPPDTTLTLHEGYVHYETWSPDYPWVCSPPYYTMGVAIGEGVTVVYRVQWIQTNLGILRSGESDYLPSFVLYGLHGSHGNSNWQSCYDHSGAPYEDETILATLIDTDMHGCPNHDVDWQGDSDSYSESV